MSDRGAFLPSFLMEPVVRFFGAADGAWRVAVCVAVSRTCLMTALLAATGGGEISNDVAAHMDMSRHPISLSGGVYGQHPPLLSFLEMIFAFPAQLVFPDAVALRLCMIAYEIILSVIFYLCMERLSFSPERRAASCLAFLLLPTGWIVSAIMSQDEVIASAILLGSILLLLRKQQVAALALCSLGVVGGKLFLLIPLAVFGLATNAFWNWRKIAAASLPFLVVYAAMALSKWIQGLPLPFSHFVPDPYYGANFWPVLKNIYGMDISRFGAVSGLVALALSLLPALVAKVFGRLESDADVVSMSAASLLIFFSVFYHVEPEYLILVTPLLILAFPNPLTSPMILLVSTLPWLTKFLQGVEFQMVLDRSPGKRIFNWLYHLIFAGSPESALAVSQVLATVVFLCTAGLLLRRLWISAAPKASGEPIVVQAE